MAGITEVARKSGVDQRGVREVLDAIKEIAAGGEKVQIQNFGTFEVKRTKERIANNPRTKEKVTVPAGTRFTFKPSKPKKG